MARNKNNKKLPESAFNPELPSEPTEETIQDTPEEIVNEEQPEEDTVIPAIEQPLATQITLATVNAEDLKDKVLILAYNMFKKSDNDLELYDLLKANGAKFVNNFNYFDYLAWSKLFEMLEKYLNK